jgi:hypothetical protein
MPYIVIYYLHTDFIAVEWYSMDIMAQSHETNASSHYFALFGPQFGMALLAAAAGATVRLQLLLRHGTVSFVHFKSLKAPPPPPLCQGHPAFRPSGTPSSRRSPSKPYLPDRNWQIQPMSMGKKYPYPIILVG